MSRYSLVKNVAQHSSRPEYTVSIPASSVSGTSNLTNFPLMIDLSVMPASFFEGANLDGGNIRVYSHSGTQLPIDIQDFRKYARSGKIWVKVPTLYGSYTTELKIKIGKQDLTLPPHESEMGGSAVWSDYSAVFLGGYNTYNKVGNRTRWTSNANTRSLYYEGEQQRFNDDFHQGVAWDKSTGNTICIDTNELVIFNSAWTEVDRNADPCGDASTASGLSLTHTCDGTVVGDYFIMPINNYPTDTIGAISVWNKNTLDLVKVTQIDDPTVSGLCWNPDIQKIVTVSWGNSGTSFTHMWLYDLNFETGDVTPAGSIALNDLVSDPLLTAQGVEYYQGIYWVSDDYRQNVVPVEANGSYDRGHGLCKVNLDNSVIDSNFEGITVYKDGLAILVDPYDGTNPSTGLPWHADARSYLAYWTAYDGYYSSAFNEHWETLVSSVGSAQTTNGNFTIGATMTPAASTQMAVGSFHQNGTSNTRATLVMRTSAGGFKPGLWDSSNSWLMEDTPADLTVSTKYRMHGVWDKTGSNTRSLYLDGVKKTASGSYATALTTLNKAHLGSSDDDHTESIKGLAAFYYIRGGALSSDWIATECAMMDSSTFLSVTEKTNVDPQVDKFMSMPVITNEPEDPFNGMIAIADGTSWDPMSTGTQTMVVYLGGAWRTLANA